MPSHTEEERKKRREEQRLKGVARTKEVIGRREKLASQRDISSKRAGRELVPELERERAVEQAELKKQERQDVGIEFLTEKGFFEREQPTEVTQLDLPPRVGLEKEPVIGPGIAALKQTENLGPLPSAVSALAPFPTLGIPAFLQAAADLGLISQPTESLPLLQDPETEREIFLQEIQKEVIKQGTTQSENFGAFVEALPFGGQAATKFGGELIEDPRSNVDGMVEEIREIGTGATNTREKVLNGKAGNPFLVFDRLTTDENRIAELKQKINIISMESAELFANAVEIDKIEREIFDTETRLFDAKEAAAAGITGVATTSSLFFELRELKGGR